MPEPDQIEDAAHQLISSTRVEGTPVFGRTGEKLGSVHSVMIDKVSGQVAYALLAFGGFLHMGEHVHPIPWEKLRYDPGAQGYVVELSRETLDNAPVLSLDEADRPTTTPYQVGLYHYYGLPGFW